MSIVGICLGIAKRVGVLVLAFFFECLSYGDHGSGVEFTVGEKVVDRLLLFCCWDGVGEEFHQKVHGDGSVGDG